MLPFCPARCCMCFCVFYKVETTFGHMKQASKQYKLAYCTVGQILQILLTFVETAKKNETCFFGPQYIQEPMTIGW